MITSLTEASRITWKPQQTMRHSPPGRQKFRISYICHERIDASLTEASRGISNDSVWKIYKESIIFSSVFSLTRSTRKSFVWELSTGTPRQSAGFPGARCETKMLCTKISTVEFQQQIYPRALY